MIVGARLEARSEEVISMGWHTAAFSGQPKLKALSEYLKTPTRPQSRDKGAADLRAMIGRLAKKGRKG